jgi:hypothetical protein
MQNCGETVSDKRGRNVMALMRRHISGAAAITPAEKQTDIAGLALRKIEHLRREIETVRSERGIPPLVNLRRFAAQGFRSCVIWWIIDRPRIIRTKIARKAQQQILLLAMFGGPLGFVKELTPVRIADLRFDHLLDLFVPTFHGRCFHFLYVLGLSILERPLRSSERFGGLDIGRRLRLIVCRLLHFSLLCRRAAKRISL